jgi:hypothetical protein
MVLRCLDAYLPLRHNQLEKVGLVQETTLLVSRYGQRLSGSAISNGIHDIARLAQVPIHSLHQFRHSCASDLLEAGVHLAEVQRILGHSVISTTVRYVHIADPQRRAAIALHPICQTRGSGILVMSSCRSTVSRQTLLDEARGAPRERLRRTQEAPRSDDRGGRSKAPSVAALF